MSQRICVVLAVLGLLLAAPTMARAQQPEPPVFTFVAEWDVPRTQWAEFTANWEKNARPILERALADGTIMHYGIYATAVHEDNGITHGSWWAASSIAATQRVRDELVKIPPVPSMAGAKHHDYLLRSIIHRGGKASVTGGYLWVNMQQVQAGKGQQLENLFKKYIQPTFDELLANGTIVAYEISSEQVHTENPAQRFIWYVTPNADGVDKVLAAIYGMVQKRSPEENRGITASFDEVTVPAAHRDYFAQVLSYAHK